MYRTNETERIKADFEKLIKHYANEFIEPQNREDVEAELWCFLYELVNSNRAISQRYVAVAIRNKYIEYCKKIQKKAEHEMKLEVEYGGYVKDDKNNYIEKIEIRDLLNKLGVKQREVIVLHYVNGLSFDEIAKKRGCSRQASARLSNRGIKTLKKMLSEDDNCTK